jgi:hypothetical protein
MKIITAIVGIMALSASLAGCANSSPEQQRTAAGAVLGGATAFRN